MQVQRIGKADFSVAAMNDCTVLRFLVLGALWGCICGFELELPTSVRTESPAPPVWAPQYKVCGCDLASFLDTLLLHACGP